jgi:hypothetical protein
MSGRKNTPAAFVHFFFVEVLTKKFFLGLEEARVARWYISEPKSQFWYILAGVGMEFYGNLLPFMTIWYIS